MSGLVFLAAACSTTPAPLRECPGKDAVDYYFPATISLGSNIMHKWYVQELTRLGVKSLSCGTRRAEETYRFIWLRSFDPPATVTITIRGDVAEVAARKAIFGPYRDYVQEMMRHPNPSDVIRKIIRVEQSRRSLSSAELTSFREALARMDFWAMETLEHPEVPGIDGTEWILEGIDERGYHIVDRWEAGTKEFRALGMLLLTLSGFQFSADERFGAEQ